MFSFVLLFFKNELIQEFNIYNLNELTNSNNNKNKAYTKNTYEEIILRSLKSSIIINFFKFTSSRILNIKSITKIFKYSPDIIQLKKIIIIQKKTYGEGYINNLNIKM